MILTLSLFKSFSISRPLASTKVTPEKSSTTTLPLLSLWKRQTLFRSSTHTPIIFPSSFITISSPSSEISVILSNCSLLYPLSPPVISAMTVPNAHSEAVLHVIRWILYIY